MEEVYIKNESNLIIEPIGLISVETWKHSTNNIEINIRIESGPLDTKIYKRNVVFKGTFQDLINRLNHPVVNAPYLPEVK